MDTVVREQEEAHHEAPAIGTARPVSRDAGFVKSIARL